MRKIGRVLVLALVSVCLATGGIAIAGNGPPSSGGPGNSGETKPGKGCGDKNHYHEREAECKKPPK